MRQVMREDRRSDKDCDKEKESRPSRRRRLPPPQKKDAIAPDDSLESPVDDSDLDCDYKEESSKDDSSEPSDDDEIGLAADKAKDLTAKKTTAKTEYVFV